MDHAGPIGLAPSKHTVILSGAVHVLYVRISDERNVVGRAVTCEHELGTGLETCCGRKRVVNLHST